jgi:hypothetical protein
MWLVVRYGSGFCELGKEASSSAAGRQNVQIFNNTQIEQDFSYKEIKDY